MSGFRIDVVLRFNLGVYIHPQCTGDTFDISFYDNHRSAVFFDVLCGCFYISIDYTLRLDGVVELAVCACILTGGQA